MKFSNTGGSRRFRLIVPILVGVGLVAIGAAAGAAQLVEILSVNSSQGSCQSTGPDSFECDLDTLPAGETARIQVSARPHGTGTIFNTAIASSNERDVDPTDDRDDETTLVVRPQPVADVAISKTDFPDPVGIGQPLTYRLHVINHGPDAAPNIVVVDRLPYGVSLSSVMASRGSCSSSGSFVDCSLGTLPVGARAMVTIVVVPHSAGSYLNEAAVSTTATDPNGTNNVAVETTTVVGDVDPAVNLRVTKIDRPDPVHVGEVVTYTISVTNEGPSEATGVMVRDIMEFLASNP